MENFYRDCAKSLGTSGASSLDALRQTSLLITGGSGFVGLWLATFCAFLNDKHNFGVELTLTSRRQARLDQMAPHLTGRRDINFVAADIRQFIDIPAAASWIIHAAGTPDNRAHAANPIETMDVIAAGTYRVLRSAEQCANLQMVLNLSSAAIYGSQPPHLAAIPESFIGALDPATALSAYAEAKRYGEALCASARSQSRTPVIIARPFSLIGPFQALDAPWAVNNFLHAALARQSLKILGDGSTKRSFLYGSDMALLLLRMLTAGTNGGIFNVGHPDGIALRDLAALVVQACGAALEIKTNTAGGRAANAHLVPDMARAAQLLDFKPAFAIGDAIAQTLAWHQARAKTAA